MNDSTQPLDGEKVLAAYVSAFGGYDRDVLKMASVMQVAQPLLREMLQAVDSGQAMNFSDFAQRLHAGAAAANHGPHTSPSTTRLSPSEIESLRQETKLASAWAKAELAKQR